MIKNKEEGEKTVLVVEDEQMLSRAICMKLNKVGIATVAARSVSQAIDYLDLLPGLSAVWLDHYLIGEDDGLVLVSKLKSDNSTKKNMPIFVVSNTASESKMRAYINLGIDKYVVKADTSLNDIVNDIMIAISESETKNVESISVPVSSINQIAPPVAAPITPTPTLTAEPLMKNTPIEEPSVQINQKTVLIVEDEEVLRKALAKAFIKAGFNVLQAKNGEEGYSLTAEKHPDAIVLDNEMPVLNGAGMLKKIKENSVERPFTLVLSNSGSTAVTLRMLEYGITQYLIKADNSLPQIVDMVQKHI